MLPEIVANMDRDIVKPPQRKTAKDGVDIFTSTRVESIQESAGGLTVTTSSQTGEKNHYRQKSALVSGPKTGAKNLTGSGCIKTARGAIVVNQKMQTNVPHIYAIGDGNGGVMLAHVASAEGILAVETIMWKKDHKLILKPFPIAFIPNRNWPVSG